MQRESLIWLSRAGRAAAVLFGVSLIAALDTALVFRLPWVFASVNLPLLATLAASLFAGREFGVGFAFLEGLLCDVALGNALGARSIPLIVFAAAVGLMESRLFREHPLTWALLGILGSLLHDLVYYCVIGLAGYLPFIWADLVKIAVFGALINGLLSLVCLMPLYLRWRSRRRESVTGLG